jgi:FKBP-type peptidyl-prolyl cis-trans isomerase
VGRGARRHDVGGKRQLVIPANLAYGPNDYGPIPGNSVLVFTVDALSAQ